MKLVFYQQKETTATNNLLSISNNKLRLQNRRISEIIQKVVTSVISNKTTRNLHLLDEKSENETKKTELKYYFFSTNLTNFCILKKFNFGPFLTNFKFDLTNENTCNKFSKNLFYIWKTFRFTLLHFLTNFCLNIL